jgi:hypothetical protein
MYLFIYLFGKRLSFKDLNILNDDATATKLGKKKKKHWKQHAVVVGI